MPLSGDPFIYSLYFHIPFCTKKCDYCHFYVIPDQPRFKNIYMRALFQEWELRKPCLPPDKPISIYFGGGTPALLGPGAIHRILSWIEPLPHCEITLEANPENVSLALMQEYFQCGINRISLGVQTFDDGLLNTLSRTHVASKSQQAIEETAQAGFQNISIDLMYDLPGQTLHMWEQTIAQALSLPITHLSLYNLTIEPHTVFFKKKHSLTLPEAETSLAMLLSALDAFEKKGLHRYEISAFAKQGMYSRHNTGYWTGRPFLGFGPSAFSYWNGTRFRNVAHLNRYAKALEQKIDPLDFSETLPPKDQLKELLAIGLRLIEGIPLPQLPQEIESGLRDLESQELLVKSANKLRLTEKGLLFHDSVAEIIMNL